MISKKDEKKGSPLRKTTTFQPEVEKKHYDEDAPITQTTEILPNTKSEVKIKLKGYLGEPNTKIYSLRFSDDDKYLAAATSDGDVHIYNMNMMKRSYLLTPESSKKTPFSCVRWRPKNTARKTKNVLVTTNTEGEIQHWHMNSGKLLSTTREDEGKEPTLNNLDYNPDGLKFAVVGNANSLKVFDEETRKLEYRLTGEDAVIPGHSSRIFCVKFDKENPNILITGGWDSRVLIWDLRDKNPVRNISGPRIYGEAIDIFEEYILTCSHTEENQMQLWDLGSAQKITDVSWDTGKTSTDTALLYCGAFSKIDGSLMLGAGKVTNECKIFDRNHFDDHVATIHGIAREVVCCDFGNQGNMFAIGGGDGYIRVFSTNVFA